MAARFFPFFPELILKRGIFVLCGGGLIGAMVFLLKPPPSLYLSLDAKAHRTSNTPLSFDLDLDPAPPTLSLPKIEGEMTFSFDPSRPDGSSQLPLLFVRMIKTAQSQRVTLPARIDLKYNQGLAFSDNPSSFWMELRSLEEGQIEGRVFVSTPAEEKIEAGIFVAAVQESPIQAPHEFPEGSPFRILSEARWWGHDLLREKYEEGALFQRIEIGPLVKPDLMDVSEGEWIAWKEGKWQKLEALSQGKHCPIARISSCDGKSLLMEGWDLQSHIRIRFTLAQIFPFKVKTDELFTSVRIRSEKQISCMLEKQCLILRTGDWVFKGEHRWRILRKQEEKNAYLKGALTGELFIFDRIDLKGGQKAIQGHLFNVSRSQMVPIEIAVNSQRKNAKVGTRKK